jgi:PAS domain S-box-containing protein
MAGVDYFAIFEASPNPYAVIDRELRHVAVNAAYCHVAGSRREELIGTHMARELREAVDDVFAIGRPAELQGPPYRPFEIVKLRFHRSGSAALAPLFDARGRVELVLVHLDSIARDPSAEELLARERAELREAQDTARSKSERAFALLEHLSMLRYELVSHADVIAFYVERLRSGDGSQEHRKAVERLGSRSQGLLDLIAATSAIPEIATGEIAISIAPTELADVARTAVTELGSLAKLRGVPLDAAIEPTAFVYGDRGRLAFAVTSLLRYAIVCTTEGGQVSLRLEVHGGEIQLSVLGTTAGPAAEDLPGVFARFFPFESSSGLVSINCRIARYFIEAHGGEFAGRSDGEGRALTFTVRLPVAREKLTGLRVNPGWTIWPAALEGLRVLIVDDDTETRALGRVLLERCQAQVDLAASVREAVARLKEAPCDVVISDLGMSEDEGGALIRQIRTRPVDRGGRTLAIALTAGNQLAHSSRAHHLGFDDHVAKPIEPAKLLAIVSSVAATRVRGN